MQEKAIDKIKQKHVTNKGNTMRFVKEFMWPRRGYIFTMFVVLIFMQVYSSLVPQFSKYLIDNAQSNSTERFFIMVITVGIWLISLLFLKGFAQFVSRYFFMLYEQKIEFALKEKIYEKTLHLKVGTFDENNEGYFMSRINKDPWFMGQFANNVPTNLIEGVSSLFLNLSFIFLISWEAGLTSILVVIISTYYSIKKKSKFNDNFKILRKLEDITGKQITNDFVGIREVKNYNAYEHTYKTTSKAIDDVMDVNIKHTKLMASWVFSNKIFISLITILFTVVGAIKVVEGSMTLGNFTALLMYSTAIQTPINSFLALYETFFKSTVSIDKYYNFMGRSIEDVNSSEIGRINGAIQIRNLNKAFNNMHILKNISLDIKAGEKIAIVGKTGAGKSTLVKMIMKYYKPDTGEISFDSNNIWNCSTKSVRDNITYMSQDPFISFDTIRNNIMISNKSISPEKYERVKNMSLSSEFINALSNKDESNIGPKGITLSGGQRQRLALARVFTKDTSIIIFDEATSNLDNITENSIKKAIGEFAKNKTVITIAHRLTTIRDSKRIIVMHDGEIVEDGTWNELIDHKQHFYEYVSLMSDNEVSHE